MTNNYGGNTLLLRQYLLDEIMPFTESPHGNGLWASNDYGAYYEQSGIDSFLNNKFLENFSEQLQEKIAESKIEITAKSSLGITGDDSLIISRKVFLLSLKELNGAESRASVPEGKTLKYFDDDYTRRTACFSNGEKCPYWTRTPETWETYSVFTIGVEGTGVGTADILSGIRPAFCIENTAPVIQSENVISGQVVYILDLETPGE